MSYDVQLAWPCPHLIVEEPVQIEGDRVTLPVTMPISSTQTVQILANDELSIPSTGLQSHAQLFSGRPGPYDMAVGSDTLTVETSGGSWTLALGVPRATRYTAAELVLKFHRLLTPQDPIFIEAVNEHLVFTDTNRVGIRSYVKVSGTGQTAFGFADGWSVRGQHLYPAWALIPVDGFGRRPQFTSWIRTNPQWKVTYTTTANRCKRCQGIQVENDCRFGVDGDVILVDGEDLLYQAALKILLTEKGSNPYHREYGASLMSRIGTKATAGVVAALSEEVRSALSKLQTLQRDQARYQTVSSEERLYAITGMSVQPHVSDPTTYQIQVGLQNASTKPITLSIVYTAPGATSIVGPNGLRLG